MTRNQMRITLLRGFQKTGDRRNVPQFFDECRLVNVRSVLSSPLNEKWSS